MLFRTLILWAAGLPVTALLFAVVLLCALLDRSGDMVHSVGSLWARIVLALAGVKVEVRGLENLPAEGPMILAANHRGIFDIPAVMGCVPVRFRWIAKKSLFSIPVIGWTMSLAGYIAIERERATKAYRSMLAAAKKISEGTSVLIFPEGTRNTSGRGLLPLKRGGFLLAARSGVPIVPLAIVGTRDIMRDGSMLIRPSNVTILIGEPIETGGRTDKELRELTAAALEAGLARIEGAPRSNPREETVNDI
ncbi:MAG TPA: 1-acyl-sn-glycerol-3-phosphate acyltransferase [Deltaproteobacteria bacterium]|nr:1-acyl-sn-glycerol-3-phosphate acyltransferase [Deltaproteobacteria bacterium]